MKKRLTYLASALGLLLFFVVSVLPAPQIAAATLGPAPLAPIPKPQSGNNQSVASTGGLWPPSSSFPRMPSEVSSQLGVGYGKRDRLVKNEKNAAATCGWLQKSGHDQYIAGGCVTGYYYGLLRDAKDSDAGPTCSSLFKGNDPRKDSCVSGLKAGIRSQSAKETKDDSKVTGYEEWKALCNALKKINNADARRLAATECTDAIGKSTAKISNAKENICKDFGGGRLKDQCDNLQKVLDDELGVPSDDASDEPPSCESTGGALAWIMCPFIQALADALDSTYDNIIKPLLVIKPINLTEPGQDDTNTFEIWSTFRIYGNIILIIALLVIIFSEAIGGGLVDAYTVRKTLPRLLVAAILINLSIYIVALAVDVSNIVGIGIQSLLEAPFRAADAFEVQLGFGAAAAAAAGGIGMGALLGAGAAIWASGMLAGFLEMFLLFFLIPAFLGIMAVMITILIRTGLIIFLTIISPVAFALYCLPNTEKYFKQWWDLLFRTLLVFPIIAVVFAMGNILAVTMSSTASGITGALTQIMSIFALILPLFLIPFSFRMAGGIMGQLSGIVQDRKNGLSAPLKKFRAGRAKARGKEMYHRAEGANWYRNVHPDSRRAKLNKAIQNMALAPKTLENSGGKLSKMRENMKNLKSQDRIAAIARNAEHSTAFQQMSKVDTLINAASHGNMQEGDWRQYLQDQGWSTSQVDQGVAQIRAAKADMGESFEAAALIANSGTGTGLAGGPAEVARHIARISEGDIGMQGALIAQVKGTAKQAGRGDLADPSFGAYQGAIRSIGGQNTPEGIQAAEEAAQDSLNNSGFNTLNPAQTMNDRGLSLQNRIPTLRRNLQKATQLARQAHSTGSAIMTDENGQQVTITAEEADQMAMRAAAQIGALQASGGTMENREILSREILSQDMPTIPGAMEGAGTVQDNLEGLKTNPLYQQYLTQFVSYVGAPSQSAMTVQEMAGATERQRAEAARMEEARKAAEEAAKNQG